MLAFSPWSAQEGFGRLPAMPAFEVATMAQALKRA